MGIYIFCFLIGLAMSAAPFVIQLVICLNTDNMSIRLAPVMITGVLFSALTFLTAGNGLYEIFTTSLFPALLITHGVPFLIARKK